MRKHVVILLENEPYPYDRRVRQEAEALVADGYLVTVCSPTGFGHVAPEEIVDGVRVLRYSSPPAGEGVGTYLREYAVSLVHLSRLLYSAHRRRRVDVVIVCTPPDILVLPALPLRLAGAALIVDHHDLSPELFAVKFGARPVLLRLVRGAEKLALRSADVVIATNDTYAEVQSSRGRVPRDRIFCVRNGPDPRRIHPVEARPELRRGRDKLVCWVGLMSSQEGLTNLLDAAEHVAGHRDDVGFVLVGAGDARADLIAETAHRGLADVVHFPGRAGDDLLRAYMSTADVCVSVDEPNPLNDASTMTKVIEYMVMGRPIVQFPLRETARVCGDACLYARPGDARDLARCIERLLDDPVLSVRLGKTARYRAVPDLLWSEQVPHLRKAVATAVRSRADSRRSIAPR